MVPNFTPDSIYRLLALLESHTEKSLTWNKLCNMLGLEQVVSVLAVDLLSLTSISVFRC